MSSSFLLSWLSGFFIFFFNETAPTEIYTLSLHDALPISLDCPNNRYVNDEKICQALVGMWSKIGVTVKLNAIPFANFRSEEHTSELQSQSNLVCRLLLEKKKITTTHATSRYEALIHSIHN